MERYFNIVFIDKYSDEVESKITSNAYELSDIIQNAKEVLSITTIYY